MFIFPTFALPAYFVASSSTAGAIMRQGAHQGAQKSTNTGTEDFKTSFSKLSSPSVSTCSLAMDSASFLSAVSRPLQWTRLPRSLRQGRGLVQRILSLPMQPRWRTLYLRPVLSAMAKLHDRMFIAQSTLEAWVDSAKV